MESTNESLNSADTELLEEGYFICPLCGEKDLVFFETGLSLTITEEQYNRLSEEQKLYFIKQKKQYTFGCHICENCHNKFKRYSQIRNALCLISMGLLYFSHLLGICAAAGVLCWDLVNSKTANSPRKIDFDHAWRCGAVRKLAS